MYRFRSRVIAAALIVGFCIQIIVPTAVLAAGEALKVPVGTPVLLSFEGRVHPASAVVGGKIYLRVEESVRVGGKIVIAEGSRAVGEITHSQKKGAIGKPAIIGVVLRSVEAVDGTRIPVSGSKLIEGESKQTSAIIVTILCCVLGLLMQGGEAEIAAGSTVEAMVEMAVEVSVEGPGE